MLNIRKYIRRWFIDDWWRKLLALLAAVIVYYYGFSNQRAEVRRLDNVPLAVVVPSDLMNMDGDNRVYRVTLYVKVSSGAKTDNIAGRAEVDINYFSAGLPYTVKLEPDNFKMPFGVEIERIAPDELTLNLQKKVNREIRVEVVTAGNPGKEYSVRASSLPATVQVTGPEQIVNEIQYLQTVPVPLSETVSDSFDYSAGLQIPDKISAVSPSVVNARIEVTKNKIINESRRRKFRVPVHLMTNPGEQFKKVDLEVSAAEVEVNGPADEVNALQPGDIYVFADISQKNGGISDVTLNCHVRNFNIPARILSQRNIKVNIKN